VSSRWLGRTPLMPPPLGIETILRVVFVFDCVVSFDALSLAAEEAPETKLMTLEEDGKNRPHMSGVVLTAGVCRKSDYNFFEFLRSKFRLPTNGLFR
jgi:hypothetical protein